MKIETKKIKVGEITFSVYSKLSFGVVKKIRRATTPKDMTIAQAANIKDTDITMEHAFKVEDALVENMIVSAEIGDGENVEKYEGEEAVDIFNQRADMHGAEKVISFLNKTYNDALTKVSKKNKTN